eukprot:357708-Chlamydomonas_euryale.AAC.4
MCAAAPPSHGAGIFKTSNYGLHPGGTFGTCHWLWQPTCLLPGFVTCRRLPAPAMRMNMLWCDPACKTVVSEYSASHISVPVASAKFCSRSRHNTDGASCDEGVMTHSNRTKVTKRTYKFGWAEIHTGCQTTRAELAADVGEGERHSEERRLLHDPAKVEL